MCRKLSEVFLAQVPLFRQERMDRRERWIAMPGLTESKDAGPQTPVLIQDPKKEF